MSPTFRDCVAEFVGKPPGLVGVYMIHLRRAVEREPLVRAMEEALQTPIELVGAADGVALVAEGHPTTCALDSTKQRSEGEVGCLVSHVEVARKALAAGLSHAVVFEDDCVVGGGFSLEAVQFYFRQAKKFAEEFSMAGTEDFLLLGSCGCYSWRHLTQGVMATNNFNGSHAYLIGRPMMEKLVIGYEFLKEKGVVTPADCLLPIMLRGQKRWAMCPDDDKGLFMQNRDIPSYIVSDGTEARKG